MLRRALAVFGLALAVCACGHNAAAPAPAAGPAALTNGPPPPPFLALVPDAPERVAHGGLRRVTYSYDVGGLPQRLSYDERVWADGQGRYSIQLVSVAEPPMTQPQREIFQELQGARQGFFFKYRDPRIRNLTLFLENYSVTQLPDTQVAGVACAELDVRRRSSVVGGGHRLAIDPVTGLVLRAVELDSGGATIATTEFVEFTLAPDFTGVQFHVERYPGTPLSSTVLPDAQPLATPQVIPSGFRGLSADQVDLGSLRYVRRVYGDGFENLFFLQGQSTTAAGPSVLGSPDRLTVRMAQVGPWRIAQLDDGPRELFVLGKVSEADVLQVLQSAL